MTVALERVRERGQTIRSRRRSKVNDSILARVVEEFHDNQKFLRDMAHFAESMWASALPEPFDSERLTEPFRKRIPRVIAELEAGRALDPETDDEELLRELAYAGFLVMVSIRRTLHGGVDWRGIRTDEPTEHRTLEDFFREKLSEADHDTG